VGLNLLEGRVVGDFHPRHRHQEFIQFLRRIQREFSGQTSPHLVMHNSGAHGTPEVKRCLKAHPCFVIHFVPASCNLLNLIERWFAELTNKRIRRVCPLLNARPVCRRAARGTSATGCWSRSVSLADRALLVAWHELGGRRKKHSQVS
jgi:transposase